jgi:hypothetical protein
LGQRVTDAATNTTVGSVQNQGTSAWDALPYFYLLRVQIITFLALLSFPFVALWFAPNLLRGVFDVTPMGMVFVTLGAALASWTVMVTAWQVLQYGHERFQIRKFPFFSSIVEKLPARAGRTGVFALFSLPVILTAMYISKNGGTSTYLRLLLGVGGGAFLAVAILAAGDQFNSQKWSKAKPVTKLLSRFGPGFKQDGNSAYEGHYTAFWSFLLCFLVYVAIGFGKFFRIGDPTTVPTLADLLVLLMILCWGLSAATFILDLFRVPLMLLFLVAGILSTQFHDTDSYFYMFRTKSTPDLSPAQVIRAGKPGSAVILVAASGGGIKAAAWTTRVLTGLEESNPRVFGDSVRLISAVSGGGVGAMYFVSEYEGNAGLPSNPKDLEEAVARSEASSLDDIAWGLVYADLIHVYVPFFKHLDRGTALEEALTRELPNRKHHLFSPLSDWREGVLEGWRPAVVFNATVVESGERFLLGTTDLSPAPGRSSLRDTKEFPQFAGRDISLVTAARLSATFPYVSPAARPDIAGKQIHAVDGGYTDNYGMATLLAWLDEGLRAPGNPVRRVLIIEIRASPPATEPPALSWRGWSFQSYAPISAMLNARDTGQLPRNQEELDILRRFAASCNIDIEDAVFEYPPEDAPLSWHLSPNDQKEIEKFWVSSKTDKPKETVRAFLAAAPPPPVTTLPPSACQ